MRLTNQTHSQPSLTQIHRAIESAEAFSFVLAGIETEVSSLAGSTESVIMTTASRQESRTICVSESSSAEAIVDSDPLGHRVYPLAFAD